MHSTLQKLYSRNTAKNFRKGILNAPLLDPKNYIFEARGKEMSVYSCIFSYENFCSRNGEHFYLVGCKMI